ncbi:MAG: hypothetical protein HUU18_12050 [Phycisphaerales bacterium]|jgi:hypothetical protein|nr:hypothetical protein [Phycisphaerales bacterium]
MHTDTEASIIQQLLNEDILIPSIMMAGGVVIVLICSVSSMVRSVARERTRREIAAFIAEGSLTPEQGERLMQAGRSKCG